MINKKGKFNGGWLAVIALVLLCGGLVTLAYFLSSQVASLRNTEKAILMFKVKENNFDDLQKQVSSLHEDKLIIDNYFITDETLPSFIERLETLASSVSVELNITNVAMTTGANPLMRLHFLAKGSFPRLFQFVSLVESLPFALDLTQAAFSQSEEDGVAVTWNGEFNLDLITLAPSS